MSEPPASAPARGREEIYIDIADAFGDAKKLAELRAELAALSVSPAPAKGDRERDCAADSLQMLIRDNKRMRLAGTALAEAALRVVKTYDGTHRLSIAVAGWARAIADEGDRALLTSGVGFTNFNVGESNENSVLASNGTVDEVRRRDTACRGPESRNEDAVAHDALGDGRDGLALHSGRIPVEQSVAASGVGFTPEGASGDAGARSTAEIARAQMGDAGVRRYVESTAFVPDFANLLIVDFQDIETLKFVDHHLSASMEDWAKLRSKLAKTITHFIGLARQAPSPSFHDGVEQAARLVEETIVDTMDPWERALRRGIVQLIRVCSEDEWSRRLLTPQATGGGR